MIIMIEKQGTRWVTIILIMIQIPISVQML